MKITYDREANAAYIYLVPIANGGVAQTYPCDPVEVNGMINLDFDREGRLLGIEVLDASHKLPKAVLDAAQ
jgi:uncharacterized protein YuzE